MRPKRDPVPRARDSWVWLSGLALLGILGGGVTAAAGLLWENIDIRQLVPQLVAAPPAIPAPLAPSPAARDSRSFEAVFYASSRNTRFFPDSAFHEEALDAWRALVRDAGGRVRVVRTETELAVVSPEALLVMVESPCLTTGEIAAVRSHLQRGGGVLANWALGARDGDCAWRGWGPVQELTGAEDVREISGREALFLTVPAGISMAPGLDPGTRIELRPDPSLALRIPGARVYWSDWALNPVPDESGGGADVAAIAARSPLGGRIAWFGLRLRQAATDADAERLRRLVSNGVAWAAGTVVAAPAPWPGARRAALVFALDVEAEPRNASQTAALFRELDVPATYFVVSQIVQEDEQLARELAATGEVGTQTADHSPVVGLTMQDQRIRLRRSSEAVEAWTGTAPVGLHPPEESFDQNTLSAWAQAGGRYLVAFNDVRSASPEVHMVPEGPMVVLPRILKDDYNVIVQDRVIRAVTLGDAFQRGTRKMHAIGGVAVVASHTQIMRTEPRLNALRAVVDSARTQGDWWIASGRDVADWWRVRSGVQVSFVEAVEGEELGAGVRHVHLSDVLVQAPATEDVEGLWVDVVVPTGDQDLIALVDGRSVDFAETPWGVRVPLAALPAGTARRIALVTLEDTGAQAP